MSKRSYLSFVLVALALFANTGLFANAGPAGPLTTVTVNYKAFPTNGNLLTFGSFTSGGTVKLSAPGNFYGKGTTYEFLFWDENASLHEGRNLTFTPPAESTVAVTAWYLEVGGGPCTNPAGCTGVTTWAFSLNQDKVIANTPIEKVIPAKAWAGGSSTTVSTTTGPSAVTITAQPEIMGSGKFKSWLELPKTSVTSDQLTVAARGAADAIAFYGFPEPDPCQSLRNEVQNFICDLPQPNPRACEILAQDLNRQLQACQKKYGE